MAGAVVLVTGASGFVGRQTIKPLESLGFEVIAPSHRACDLLDPAQMRALLDATRPSHILHCAWEVTHGRFWTAPENLDWVAATLALARHAATCGVRRFVGVGTCAEYDWSDGGATDRAEGDAARPETLYGKAKLATAGLLDTFCAEAGMGFAWARLFHLFGPGEHPARFVPSIAGPLAEGRPALVRHGGLIRDMMPVEAAGAALAALVASETGGVVNIASGQGVALGDFARRLAAGSKLLTVENQPAPGQPARMVANISRLRGLRSHEA
jgi:nucleoside-diphosphate-sugar epimerase